jgi:PHD-zinc-finger like domain
MLSPENPVECLLCPTEGGAYKQTSNNRWAHLLCAMWIPECHISNTVFMEPIEGIGNIQKSRWKLRCYICEKKHGAPIQCSTKNCFTAYHPTCARKSKLYMRMRG